jgi:hypothetical protein
MKDRFGTHTKQLLKVQFYVTILDNGGETNDAALNV